MEHNNLIECGGFYFIHNFDSGNLGHVERVPTELIASFVNTKTNATETPDYEFNLWTRPDCAGTEFENGNRTWFYFGVQASQSSVLVRLNLINLNKQGKMYNQGMAPVTRTLPGKPQWERIRDRPIHSTDDNTFTLTFKYRTSENLKATTFFAFTYPFSFAELQIALNSIDFKMLPLPSSESPDDIYYCRECLIYSLEGRRVDLLTISSHHGITTEREERLKNLFPDKQDRPFKFTNKKVIFISARVHPGETPSSFVFNGFLNLLLTRSDPIAIQLRKLYVFKMIPFLNPDGVARGHYRTDTRGVNLNRVYLNPSLTLHPTVYAARAIIRYHHYGCEKEDTVEDGKSFTSRSIQNISESAELVDIKKKKSPYSPTYRSNDLTKKEKVNKSVSVSKSTTMIKQPLKQENSKKEVKTNTEETTKLVDQVNDMKLQEMPSQSSEMSHQPECADVDSAGGSKAGGSALLTSGVLRSYLGSDVHLAASEHLHLQGGNPLRQLRDTLKNSISLLMESTSSFADDISLSGAERVRTSWCQACQRSLQQMERSSPGSADSVPGYSATVSQPSTLGSGSTTYRNIQEYREHQKQQLDEQQKAQELEAEKEYIMYFCTNCFKRFIISDSNEEIKIGETVSTASVGVSAGDSGDAHSEAVAPSAAPGADSTGDASGSQKLPPKKDDKPKSPVVNKQGKKKALGPPPVTVKGPPKEPDSGLYLYIDLHGHASKKGIFMYGNHFEELDNCVECMLLPRIMSLNNLHFHFSSCNFTERNMYLKDRRDGMSREGSGRVAVLKTTGLVRSYTLECNYNTGRLVNVLPPAVRDGQGPSPHNATPPAPPKYTPHIFEEVGRSLGASILDLTGHHPNSRIPCSEHRTLAAIRDWLRAHTRSIRPQLTVSRLRPKTTSPSRVPLYVRSKSKVTEERKENTYVGVKGAAERKRSPPVLAPRSGHDIINMNMRFGKKNEAIKTTSRTRYLLDNEPKPKSLSTKRRNILAIRKPNSSKIQVGGAGVVKAKMSRRSADDSENPRTSMSAKLSKRNFSRSIRTVSRAEANICRAMASSSSDDVGSSWEEVTGGTVLGSQGGSHADPLALAGKRRSFAHPSPARVKKIRLKTGL